MSQPAAKVLLDSITEEGDRITTVEVTHHRFILAETNTHRALSRNSASSRAIPLNKMLDKFVNDPAYPAAYRAEQAGMSAGGELEGSDLEDAIKLFRGFNRKVSDQIKYYVQWLKDRYPGEDENGKPLYMQHILHKSWVNRLMEPMQWHTAIWTFDHNLFVNFLNQRLHPDAQPEFYELMKVLVPALEESEPTELTDGEWHMPLLRPEDDDEIRSWAFEQNETLDAVGMSLGDYILSKKRQISVARCARVSYLTHDGRRDISEDIKLHNRLAGQNPPHASPFEHVCTPARWNKYTTLVPQISGGVKRYNTPKIGNLYGWLQMRHAIGMP